MNILMLTSEFTPAAGGIGTYAREIAAAAARLGADVTVAAPDYGEPGVAGDDRALPFRTHRFAGGLHSMRDLPAKIRLARNLIGGDHDVVHAVDWPFFLPVALVRRQTRARLLMTVHGTEINEMQSLPKRLAVRLSGAFGPRAEVVANSGFTRDLFLAHFAMPPDKVRAIPLGVAEFWFGPRTARDDVRRRHRLDPAALVIVTVARLTRRKGHLLMLAALAGVPEPLRQKISWLIIGPDGEPDYVAELRAAAAAATGDIRFLGRLANEEIRDIYGAADLFCLTGLPDVVGRVEGFGLVYLEAGACGLPSVATAVGGVREAVLPGRSGLVVAPSAEAVAAAITRLAGDAHGRAELGRGALAHAQALSWERCAAATYGLTPADAMLAPHIHHAPAPMGLDPMRLPAGIPGGPP
jgi:glycosyltransferase involved in cell wall biosynthesis